MFRYALEEVILFNELDGDSEPPYSARLDMED
jgi:hypothetical protein